MMWLRAFYDDVSLDKETLVNPDDLEVQTDGGDNETENNNDNVFLGKEDSVSVGRETTGMTEQDANSNTKEQELKAIACKESDTVTNRLLALFARGNTSTNLGRAAGDSLLVDDRSASKASSDNAGPVPIIGSVFTGPTEPVRGRPRSSADRDPGRTKIQGDTVEEQHHHQEEQYPPPKTSYFRVERPNSISKEVAGGSGCLPQPGGDTSETMNTSKQDNINSNSPSGPGSPTPYNISVPPSNTLQLPPSQHDDMEHEEHGTTGANNINIGGGISADSSKRTGVSFRPVLDSQKLFEDSEEAWWTPAAASSAAPSSAKSVKDNSHINHSSSAASTTPSPTTDAIHHRLKAGEPRFKPVDHDHSSSLPAAQHVHKTGEVGAPPGGGQPAGLATISSSERERTNGGASSSSTKNYIHHARHQHQQSSASSSRFRPVDSYLERRLQSLFSMLTTVTIEGRPATEEEYFPVHDPLRPSTSTANSSIPMRQGSGAGITTSAATRTPAAGSPALAASSGTALAGLPVSGDTSNIDTAALLVMPTNQHGRNSSSRPGETAAPIAVTKVAEVVSGGNHNAGATSGDLLARSGATGGAPINGGGTSASMPKGGGDPGRMEIPTVSGGDDAGAGNSNFLGGGRLLTTGANPNGVVPFVVQNSTNNLHVGSAVGAGVSAQNKKGKMLTSPTTDAAPGGSAMVKSYTAFQNKEKAKKGGTENKSAEKGGGAVNKKERTNKGAKLESAKKGLAVHFGHENWNMVVNMMIGIRMAVGRVSNEMDRNVQPLDFKMRDKFVILPNIANIMDAINQKTQENYTIFVDYAPFVFRKIRDLRNIDTELYLRSVGPEQLLGNMILGNLSSLSELSSEGKSGAFFYYTADGCYMIKTVTEGEKNLLNNILFEYWNHIKKYPNNLIIKFFGLHGLRIKRADHPERKIYFVVMGNMFNTPFEIHRRYDLKGSTVKRISSERQKRDRTRAMKDLDFLVDGQSVPVGKEGFKIICDQLEKDANFLAKCNIIDYSVLLGIHEVAEDDKEDFFQALQEIGDQLAEQKALQAKLEQEQIKRGSIRPAGGDVAAGVLRGWAPSRAQRTVVGAHAAKLPIAPPTVAYHEQHFGGLASIDEANPCLFFIGVIDILTNYGWFKRVEHNCKSCVNPTTWRGVSCCPPNYYAKRFTDFMRKEVFFDRPRTLAEIEQTVAHAHAYTPPKI